MSNSWKKIITSGSSVSLSHLTIDNVIPHSNLSLYDTPKLSESNNVLLYNTYDGTLSYTSSYISGIEEVTINSSIVDTAASTGSFIFGSGSYNNELTHEMTGNLALSSSVGITANMPANTVGFYGTASHANHTLTASYALSVEGGTQQGGTGTFEDIIINNELTVKDNTKIEGQLEVDEAATFNSGVIIGGNLTVNGTHTILNTQDVFIEDRFIYLGGKQNKLFDCGIVFNNVRSVGIKDQGLGRYESIFWDQSEQKFKVATDVDPDKNDGTEPIPDNKIKGSIMIVREGNQAIHPITGEFIKNPNGEEILPIYGTGEIIITESEETFMYIGGRWRQLAFIS